jgi:hypothetical protein
MARVLLALGCADSISDRKDGDDARIYTIGIEMSNLFGAIRRVFGARRRTQRRGFRSKRGEQRRVALQPDDHDVGGFYKRGDGLAVFQAYSPTASAVMMDVIRWPRNRKP